MAINNEIKSQIRDFITEAIDYLKRNNHPTKDNVNSALNSIREAIKLAYNLSDEEINELEIPWISIYYYPARQNINNDIVIPLYITDYYQKEYTFNDNSEYFTVKYEVDGIEHQIENVPAGDYDLHLGHLDAGMHDYGVKIVDSHGRSSRTIFNDLWIVDPVEYEIKESETYTITDSDLTTYSINKNNSEVVDDMINNRIGLSQLFLDLQSRGYRKAILPTGIYRINRCTRLGTIENKDTPIDIPTNFTVDMNGSTFKLHPYSDAEYGSIAHVENLMIRMYNCFDSHIINGTFEGDYFERQQNGWISGSNGEGNNTFNSYGSYFSSLDNITIKQTTGYNVCSGQSGSLGGCGLKEWFDNIVIENGEEKTKEGFVTSGLGTMDQKLIDSKYLVYSVWLAFGGLKGLYWEVEFHFYDESQNFIKTIKSYQFTRCRIPEGAKYVRVTLRGDSSQVSGVSLHHMRSTRYFECNDCHWEDNRTCCAIFQFQHYAFNRCTFARSGQSITPCEIDLEDGWEQQQDIFMNNCETIEASGTAGLIDNSGINHVLVGCKNLRATIRYRVRGIIMKNCTNSKCDITTGFMTGNTVKVENNELTGVGYGTTGLYNDYDKVLICYKNNVINSGISVKPMHNIIFDRNIHNTNYGTGYHITNATIYPTGNAAYIHDNILVEDSVYKLSEGETISIFSYNSGNAKRIYRRCIFENPCTFNNHNNFNSGLWEDCTFKENIILNPTSATTSNESILFINCVFEKDITIKLGNNTYCTFSNCTFLGNKSFTGTSESRCIINDTVPDKLSYIQFNIENNLTHIDNNVDNAFTIYKTPFNITDDIDKVSFSTNNPNFVIREDKDNDRYLLNCNSTSGDCIITARSKSGLEKSITLHSVDVDYSQGYVNTTGGFQNYPFHYTDNKYKEASGTVSINYDTSIGMSFLRVAEYDSDKKFIKSYRVETANASSITLDTNTRFVRITFRIQSSAEKRFPLLFSTYTVTNV